MLPVNNEERAFAAGVMVIGVLIYSFIIAKTTELVGMIDINSQAAKERMMIISSYMYVFNRQPSGWPSVGPTLTMPHHTGSLVATSSHRGP